MGMNEKKSELLIQEAFQTMLRNTEDMIFVKDVDSVYVAASLAWIKMAGKETLEDVINKTDLCTVIKIYNLCTVQVISKSYGFSAKLKVSQRE